jgi:hypothetical protein
MKRRHLFVFYCTLLVPIGVLAGVGVGRLIGSSSLTITLGLVLGLTCSYLLLRRTAPDETP